MFECPGRALGRMGYGEAFGSLFYRSVSGRETRQSCASGQSSPAGRWGVPGHSTGPERPDRGGSRKDGLTDEQRGGGGIEGKFKDSRLK